MKSKKSSAKNDKSRSTGIGPRLRRWRKGHPLKASRLKAYQLAEKIKISQGSLSDIENGKSDPSASTLVNLYKYTDVNMHWLLTGEEGKFNEGEKTIPETALVINLEPGTEVTVKCNKK